MKTLNLSTGAIILGALSAAFAACSASSENNAPNAGAGASSTAGATGSGGATGFAGSTSGVAGAATGFAGATTGVAGAGVGTAGATGAAGAGTGTGGATGAAGAGTGTGGAPAMSCGTLTPVTGDAMCCVAAGTAADLPIDNLEDGDNVIMPIGQRQGYWYTYGTDPTQVPKPQSLGGTTFKPMAGGDMLSALFSADTTGSVPPNMLTATPPVYNQAGIGVGFNNHFNKSCPYDATAYKGISFWLKGNVAIKVQISTPDSVPTGPMSAGTCTIGCYDPYATIEAPPPDGATWKQFTIMFADKTTFAPRAATDAFEQSKILDLQFQVDGGTAAQPYSFGVDDVAFVTM